MLRRNFVKYTTSLPMIATGLAFAACGRESTNSELASPATKALPEELRVWSYYAPLLSYEGLFDQTEDRHDLDRLLDFDAVRRAQPRITGRRADGTENRDILVVDELRQSEEDYIRVDFWHDDRDSSGRTGHTLYLFKRYLAKLEAGETIFVATGMIQSHFHVVMIEPGGV